MRKTNPDAWPWYYHEPSGHILPLPFKPTPLEFFWALIDCHGDTEAATRQVDKYPTHTIVRQRQRPSDRNYYSRSIGDAILHYALIRDKSPLKPWREMSYELQVVEI